MGSPFTIGNILNRTLGDAGRSAATAVGNFTKRATFDDPLALATVAEKFRTGTPEGTPHATSPVSQSAPPVNKAAIHASDLRARPNIGLAQDIDFGADQGPRSQGTYVSPQQQSENRDVAARGAFQAGPEWKGVGGGLRSAAQMEQDLYAHDLINAGNEQAMAGIRREDHERGDPMSLATNARRKLSAYEDSLPAEGESFIRSSQGGGLEDYRGQREAPIGTPSLGEYRQNRSLIAQAAARQNPKDQAESATTMGRGRLAEELSILQQQLAGEVRAGHRTQADADAAYARAYQQAAGLAELLKSGFPPRDPNAMPPEPPPASGTR